MRKVLISAMSISILSLTLADNVDITTLNPNLLTQQPDTKYIITKDGEVDEITISYSPPIGLNRDETINNSGIGSFYTGKTINDFGHSGACSGAKFEECLDSYNSKPRGNNTFYPDDSVHSRLPTGTRLVNAKQTHVQDSKEERMQKARFLINESAKYPEIKNAISHNRTIEFEKMSYSQLRNINHDFFKTSLNDPLLKEEYPKALRYKMRKLLDDTDKRVQSTTGLMRTLVFTPQGRQIMIKDALITADSLLKVPQLVHGIPTGILKQKVESLDSIIKASGYANDIYNTKDNGSLLLSITNGTGIITEKTKGEAFGKLLQSITKTTNVMYEHSKNHNITDMDATTQMQVILPIFELGSYIVSEGASNPSTRVFASRAEAFSGLIQNFIEFKKFNDQNFEELANINNEKVQLLLNELEEDYNKVLSELIAFKLHHHLDNSVTLSHTMEVEHVRKEHRKNSLTGAPLAPEPVNITNQGTSALLDSLAMQTQGGTSEFGSADFFMQNAQNEPIENNSQYDNFQANNDINFENHISDSTPSSHTEIGRVPNHHVDNDAVGSGKQPEIGSYGGGFGSGGGGIAPSVISGETGSQIVGTLTGNENTTTNSSTNTTEADFGFTIPDATGTPSPNTNDLSEIGIDF